MVIKLHILFASFYNAKSRKESILNLKRHREFCYYSLWWAKVKGDLVFSTNVKTKFSRQNYYWDSCGKPRSKTQNLNTRLLLLLLKHFYLIKSVRFIANKRKSRPNKIQIFKYDRITNMWVQDKDWLSKIK